MKVGFLTACFPEYSFDEVIKFAQEAGFNALEIACWPRKNERDFASSTIDVAKLDKAEAEGFKSQCKERDVEISCLTYCDNMLDPDQNVRDARIEHLKKVIEAANLLNVGIVSCFIGRDKNRILKENLPVFEDVFKPIVKFADEKRVKIAIENCPMPGWQFEGLIGQIGFAPFMWDEIFNRIPDANLGLNFDPSHLHWLGIDYIKAAKDYKDKIFHVHAKDTEIISENIQNLGIMMAHHGGWWRYRMPGLGEIDWGRFISTLQEYGYDHVLSIEHEDPVWSGNEKKIRRGLELGLKYLRQFIL